MISLGFRLDLTARTCFKTTPFYEALEFFGISDRWAWAPTQPTVGTLYEDRRGPWVSNVDSRGPRLHVISQCACEFHPMLRFILHTPEAEISDIFRNPTGVGFPIKTKKNS